MSKQFVVSALKYRPQSFDTVVGQPSVTKTLKNAISTGKLAHSYLFFGPRGVGKTTCARIFAKTINCLSPTSETEACNNCESCNAFNEGRSYNIHELDAASNNSVEDIRNLTEKVRIPPQIGNYSVYIIDEVHMLSLSAFNAFLKTLEEPPKYAIFILATTEKHKIIPTILSRCQIYDFNRISVQSASDHLRTIAEKEDIKVDDKALTIIAQKADGAMRDALSIFDQIVSFSGKEVTYEKVIANLNVLDYAYHFKFVDSFLKGDISATMLLFNSILEKGFDSQNFIVGLSQHFRDLLMVKDAETVKLLDVADSTKAEYLEQSKKCGVMFIVNSLDILSKCDINYKMAKDKRLHVELSLIQLCNLAGIQEEKKKVDKEQIPETNHSKEKDYKKVENEKNSVISVAEPEGKTIKQNTTESNQDVSNNPVKATTRVKTKISLKNLLSEEEKKTDTSTSDQDSKEIASNTVIQDQDYTQEQLIEKWNEFTQKQISQSPLIYSILSNHLPVKENKNKLKLELANNVQETNFNTKKTELLSFLRTNLQNDNIEIIISYSDKDSKKQSRPITNSEKLVYLKEKNSLVQKLVQDMNLDFDS